MTQVVGFTPEDWPIARDAINAVRRGGLEHPFHRRQVPVGGDDTLLLRIDHTLTTFVGARNTGGIAYEASGYPVISADVDYNLTLGTPAVTVNCKHFDGLLVPGRYYNCVLRFDKWTPTDHGQSQFSKCVASGSGITDTSGNAVIYLRDGGSVESIGVECIVPEDAEPIPAGAKCTCFWDAERQVMWAVPHGCTTTSE